jgi:glutamate-1-semialdehyde 2,1-aminomutase
MQRLAPLGDVYQAGTLSGNPIAMTAGLQNLDLISQAGFYENLSAKVTALTTGLQARADVAHIPFTTNQVGGMWGLFFTDTMQVTDFAQVIACDVARFNRFFHGMLQQGVFFAPSAFEAGFVSSAHTDTDIQATLDAAEKVFAQL